jgi:hypothetical protein
MDSGTQSKSNVSAALLSAIGVQDTHEGETGHNVALLTLSGMAFVEYQINQLANFGITSILLEIDTLPGALVNIAESVAKRGISIDFVRSPAELKNKLTAGQLMFVMSEGIYVDDQLLTEIVSQQSPFIVTLDGRDENSGFERIDLNSFWSGLAVFGSQSVEAIAALPEGWSIGSSLLRRALQDSIAHRPLKQELLDTNKLCKLQTQKDVLALSQQLLHARAMAVDGVIEKYVFSPLSSLAVNAIWKFPSGKLVFDCVALILFISALLCGYFGFAAAASAAGFGALWTIHIRSLLNLTNTLTSRLSIVSWAQWGALGAAFSIVLVGLSADVPVNLFVSVMIIGLLILSFKLSLAAWRKAALCSPALINLTLLSIFLIGGGIKWIMFIALAQLGAVIVGHGPMKRNVHG